MNIVERARGIGIVPVVSLPKLEDALPLAEALLEGGCGCAEITFRTTAAAEAIARIRSRFPEILLGAGTVLTAEQAETAISGGAEFIVAPGTNPTVVDYCLSKGVTIFPGVCTPTEIEMALSKGADGGREIFAGDLRALQKRPVHPHRRDRYEKHRPLSGFAAGGGLRRELDGQARIVRGGRFCKGKTIGRRGRGARA